jgi:branched-chain amino acid transport system substrate-binding protein
MVIVDQDVQRARLEGEVAMKLRQILVLMTICLGMALTVSACSDRVATDDDASAGADQSDDSVELVGQSTDDGDAAGSDDAIDDAETDDSEVTAESDVNSLDIGVVLSLSGSNAAYGEPSLRGIELALADYEDGDYDFGFSVNVLDDEGDAQLGADRFMEQIENGVDVILGPTLSNTAFEAHPVAQENGVPVLAVSNTAEGITDTGDLIFRVSLAEEAVVPQTVDVIAQAWQPETVSLVYSEDDAWSRSSAEVFRQAVAEHNIEIVTEQDISSDGGDYSSQIDAINEANPDVILLSALEHASITFVSQARDRGLEQNIGCGNGCNTGTFISETGDASEGLIVGSAWHIDVDNEQSASFVERYRAMHGLDPDQFSAQSYGTMQVLVAAADQVDEIERESLRDALASVGTVDTVLGPFSFDESRDGHHPAVIKIVRDGSFTVYGK